jgi:hypothetical protein
MDMAEHIEPLDVTQAPDVERLAEDVAKSGIPRLLRRNGESLAVIQPLAPRSAPSRSRRTASPNRWLNSLIGIGESVPHADVSANVHAHVADAIRSEDNKPGQ